ncbi:cupin domain-containing protein [Patulibacter minatonensis]|uniref:cupin domain-containing protein n=1 Tax=Patulibacter minatonensis TaxID=298163 RepID=UPI000478C148|nr:cupin domain-containing protein [Patulibacter minatonensis]
MTQLGGVPEARILDTEHGRVPADGGWWAMNVGDLAWRTVEGTGAWCVFESPDARSATLGIGVHVLWPRDTPGKYHAEDQQEGFLVLEGRCIAIVEGQERRLGRWDYLHCPPGTAHITVGAEGGPCAILMVGTRGPDEHTRYLTDPAAARHGAAVDVETDSSAEAYAGRPPIRDVRAPWPAAPDV